MHLNLIHVNTVVHKNSSKQILTEVSAAYMTIDNVAHCGPDREPCSQSHHFARGQGALVTLLHCVHDTPCTQQDAAPKHKHYTFN